MGGFAFVGPSILLRATIVFGRIGCLYGNRAMLLCSLGMPAAVLVGYVPPNGLLPPLGRLSGLNLQSLALFVPFVTSARATSDLVIGSMTCLTAIAPRRMQPTYPGFTEA